LGQRVALIYPGGEVVTYTHDAAGRLIRVTDWEGRNVDYAYTPAGRLKKIERPNDVTNVYAYDQAGRLRSLTHTGVAGALASYICTLDALGNRVRAEETIGGVTRVITYTYDTPSRLIGTGSRGKMTNNKHRNSRKIGLVLVLCFLIAIIMGSCQNSEPQNSRLPTPTLDDPHHHGVDISHIGIPVEIKVVEVTMDPNIVRENVTANQSRTFKAFTTYEESFNIFVEDTVEGVTMEIQGFPSPWRPFSDLVWITDDILVFDRWANPHYGVHYTINIRRKHCFRRRLSQIKYRFKKNPMRIPSTQHFYHQLQQKHQQRRQSPTRT